MKKIKFYLKFGKQTSTYGVDHEIWYKDFSREFSISNKIGVYYDKKIKQVYCYERPTKLRQKDWGKSMYSLHSPDLMIDFEKEVDIEEKTIKLEPGKPKNTNWKSRNRGGGVTHKNFDQKTTKIYPPNLNNGL
jgi:hypothetical protein